ncbi:hypothetical protein [Clostridium sp. DL1XJH146]
MKNHYCIKCGEELVLKQKFCPNCKTPVEEIPLTEEKQETKEKIMKIQKKHKQNPLIGLAIVLGFLFIAFGIPFIVMKTDIGTSTFWQGLLLNIVFILVNLGLYKYKKSIKYEPKKYYNLTVKDNTDNNTENKIEEKTFTQNEKVQVQKQAIPSYKFCSKCGTELNTEGDFCGNCGSRIKGRDE